MLLTDGFEVVHHGILMVDAEGKIVNCNRAAREILGAGNENITGRDIKEFVPDCFIHKVLETGQPLLGTKLHLGSKTLISNQKPVFHNGELIGAVASFQVITELEIIASELETTKKLNKELEAIFNSSYDEIFVTDGDGVTLRVNKACERFYGAEAGEIVGRHVNDLEKQGFFSPNITTQVLEEKRRVTSSQTTKAGQKLIVTGNPVFDEDGKIIRVVTNSRDVTELANLKQRLVETEKLVDSYRNEIAKLRNEKLVSSTIVGCSSSLKSILAVVGKVAGVDSTVLIEGESGVGKSVLATEIHKLSRRSDGPFITINCGAIPETLIESELFGYDAGAFTGARREGKKGLIEMANGGTAFFDEIGEIPFNIQVKLLHAIQEKRLMRVGGNHYINVDFRIVAATNRDLRQMVRERKFREDLYYRLNVVPLTIPPLRQRREDIMALVNHFLRVFNEKYGMQKKISPDVMKELEAYHWPGNVREVENLMERLLVITDGNEIQPSHLPDYLSQEGARGRRVVVMDICGLKSATEEVERQLLKKAMNKFSNTYKIADALGVNQSTVVRKLHRYGLLDEDSKR